MSDRMVKGGAADPVYVINDELPINIPSLPLPEGAATQVTLAALLTELKLKADLTETQPVSAVQSGSWSVSNYDFGTQVARGLVSGFSRINKFGASPEGIQTTATDVWSRANAAATQQIWLAPTAARVHALASDNAGDNGAVIRVWGLASWSTRETSQDITLPGNSTALVIVHRMKLLQTAAHPTLLGTITATAATDGTVTAVILPGDNQTEMAIYGISSLDTFYLKRWGASIGRNVAASVNFKLLVNERPDLQTTGYIRKDDINLVSVGTGGISRSYEIPPSFPGPCIIKVQAISSANDTDATSGFDGYIVAN